MKKEIRSKTKAIKSDIVYFILFIFLGVIGFSEFIALSDTQNPEVFDTFKSLSIISFCVFMMGYTYYNYSKNFPTLILDKDGLEIKQFNSRYYEWDDIEEIDMTGKKSFHFLFLSMPQEAITFNFTDGTNFNFWSDFYQNSSEIKGFIKNRIISNNQEDLKSSQENTALSENEPPGKKLKPAYQENIAPSTQKKVFSKSESLKLDSEVVKFNDGHLLTFNGIVFYVVIVGYLYFIYISIYNENIDSFGIVFMSFVVLVILLFQSYQMHYVVLTQKHLIVKNSIWIWRNKQYPIEQIKEIVIEVPSHVIEKSIRIIKNDFSDEMFSVGNLKNKTWKKLKDTLEFNNINVRDDSCIFK